MTFPKQNAKTKLQISTLVTFKQLLRKFRQELFLLQKGSGKLYIVWFIDTVFKIQYKYMQSFILFLWWFIFYSKHPSQNWSKFMGASPPLCKKWNKESHLLIDVLMNNDVICYMISVHTKNITFSPLTSFCMNEWMKLESNYDLKLFEKIISTQRLDLTRQT